MKYKRENDIYYLLITFIFLSIWLAKFYITVEVFIILFVAFLFFNGISSSRIKEDNRKMKYSLEAMEKNNVGR